MQIPVLKKLAVAAASMSFVLSLLSGCASEELGGQVPSENKAWVAFLQYHGEHHTQVPLQGRPIKVFPQVLPSGEKAPMIDNPESLILNSGDHDLIALHNRLKAASSSIANLPEKARLEAARGQTKLIDQAYQGVTPSDPAPPSTEEAVAKGLDQTNAEYNARIAPYKVEADRQNARLALARQKDPEANNSQHDFDKAWKAFCKAEARYAIPSEQLLVVLQKYQPRGVQSWGTWLGTHTDGGSIEFEKDCYYCQWTY